MIIDLTGPRSGTGPARLLDMVEGRSKRSVIGTSGRRQISANSQAWCVVGVSPLVRRPTFPPVVGRFLNQNTRRA